MSNQSLCAGASTNSPSLADYWVGPIIGQGGFAQVHYARHKASNRRVAVKLMEQVTLKKRPQLLRSVLNERQILLQLRPQLMVNQGTLAKETTGEATVFVRLLSSFYDSQFIYLVTDLCGGGDLQHLIRSCLFGGRLGESLVETRLHWKASIPHYLWQIANALDHLHHNHGIVHCDLKPGNILLDHGGNIKIADFACAIDTKQIEADLSLLDDIPRGTAEYSSPELLQGRLLHSFVSNGYNLDNQGFSKDAIKFLIESLKGIDYWAFACMIFAMYSGESPFHQEDSSEALTIQAIQGFVSEESKLPLLLGLASKEERTSDFATEALSHPRIEKALAGLFHSTSSKRCDAWNELYSPDDNDGINDDFTKESSFSDGFYLLQEKRPLHLLLGQPSWSEADWDALQDGSKGWSVFFV